MKNEKKLNEIVKWTENIENVAFDLDAETEGEKIRELHIASTAIKYIAKNGTDGLEKHLNKKYPEM
jgi:hypothetical protein